jgi:hypothetical protein
VANFPKNLLFFVVSVAKPKNIVVFAFTYVWESFALFFCNFCMDIYSVDSDEAMKRGGEALNATLLQFLSIVKRFIASSLRFLLSVKRFITVIFIGKHRSMLRYHYFLKEIHRLTLQRRYFLK